METVIALLSIGLLIATFLAFYYGIQYKKLLHEYSELDKEYQKWRFKRTCEKAQKDAIKKALDKYHKKP